MVTGSATARPSRRSSPTSSLVPTTSPASRSPIPRSAWRSWRRRGGWPPGSALPCFRPPERHTLFTPGARVESVASGSGAVALLVLLAGAAPARIVAADLLPVSLHPCGGVDAVARPSVRGRSGSRGSPRGGRPGSGRTDTAPRRRGRLGTLGVVQRGGLVLAATRVRDLGRLLRRLEHLGRRGGLDGHLDVVDDPRELLPDRVHQLAEHREALVLVGDEWVDLGEAAQVDPLAQVVHLVEVLAPAVVDDLEQDLALQVAHQLLAQLVGALVVCGERILREEPRDLLAVRGRRVDLPEVDG